MLRQPAVEALPGPFWVPEAKRVTPLAHLKKEAAAVLGKDTADLTDDDLAAANGLGARLRWMLNETMGAAGEYERRRAELAESAPSTAERLLFLEEAAQGRQKMLESMRLQVMEGGGARLAT